MRLIYCNKKEGLLILIPMSAAETTYNYCYYYRKSFLNIFTAVMCSYIIVYIYVVVAS